MGNSDASELPSSIFLELASDTRCEILKMLYDKPTQATKIASILKLTKQETHRNTTRLTEVGLIRKDAGGSFSLTDFGRAITAQFSFFDFLNRHKQFFENHSLENVPEKFVKRLGDLQNTELVTHVSNVLERLKKIESGAKAHLKIMPTQGWSEEVQIIIRLVKDNITVKSLTAKHSILPNEIIQKHEKQIHNLGSRENVQLRQTESFGVAVYITESTCAVMFPNTKNQFEMDSVFVGSDYNLREWCNDVFDYYWSRSKFREAPKSSSSE